MIHFTHKTKKMRNNKELIYEPETVLDAVAKHFGVAVRQLGKMGRKPEQVRRKHIAMYLLRNLSGLTCTEVATIFWCDHSLVLYAEEKVKNAFDISDDYYTLPIKEILGELAK